MPSHPRRPVPCVLAPLLASVLAACGSGGGSDGVDAGERSPGADGRGTAAANVLLVVIDGLRADHVGSYGYPRPTTPTLDGIAERGLLFTDVITPSPWSAPATAALLTGRYPSSLGLTDLGEPLGEEARLLPEILGEAGYATGAVISHPFVSARFGLVQGFDHVIEVGEGPGTSPGEPRSGGGGARPTSAAVTDAALELLDRLGGGPFLLVVHYADPLPDWLPAPGSGAARGAGPGTGAGFDFGDPAYRGPLAPATPFEELLRMADQLDGADRAQLVAHYDGEVAYTDRQVGRLVAGLARRGRDLDTLVIATSTHGMELFDHGELGDAKTLYDELIHVPLVASGPGLEPADVERPVSLIDLVPTLLDWLGLPAEPGVEGRAEGRAKVPDGPGESRALFAETDRARSLRAVMSGRWKLIHDLERGKLQLFDLRDDPGERLDRARSRGERVRVLEAALRVWEERWPGSGGD